MNIVLIGFMGSGKSAVAKILSQILHFDLLEMDEIVLQKTHTHTMRELFDKGGELLLRETEIIIAREYAHKKHLVISTGGGVVLNKIVLDYFKTGNGKVFFLNPPFEHIIERVKNDHLSSRPLWKDLKVAKELYDFRLPLYHSYADVVMNIDSESAESIAAQIIHKVH